MRDETTITIRIEQELKESVKKLAEKNDRSLAGYIKHILKQLVLKEGKK